jgi:predicted esterase
VRIHQIAVTTHGHYLVEPSEPAPGLPLLVGFHGYAETAELHMERLRAIPLARPWRLCAVQGLHSFYRKRGAEVVASWMTRFDRELMIQDNLRYVGQVVGALREEFGSESPLVYAGFSQGAAMAYRAAQRAGHRCQGVLVLGGDLPPDVAAGELSSLPRVLIGRGARDEWYSEEKLRLDLERLEAAGVAVEACRFDAGHEWSADFVRAAGELLDAIAGAAEAVQR